MRSSWMFIWGLGLGKSVSPHISLSFPGSKEKTTAHLALSALQPHPMLLQLWQEAKKQHFLWFLLPSGRGESFWEHLT